MKSSQAISLDIMLAVVIFLGAIIFIYAILGANQSDTVENLEKDASRVLENIASENPDIGILRGIEVDETKLEQLLGENYGIVKQKIRAEKDFCI